MGAWSRALLKMRLIFVGNGSDQTGIDDLASCESEKIKWNESCRPQCALQAQWVTRPKREVLIEI